VLAESLLPALQHWAPARSSPGAAVPSSPRRLLNDGQVRDVVDKELKTTSRRVDLSTPFAQPSHHARVAA
jgi:hypothetical protein